MKNETLFIYASLWYNVSYRQQPLKTSSPYIYNIYLDYVYLVYFKT